ncbi:MAG: alpha/beta hydrolase [Geminicoccaceae bacterium]
MTWTIQPRSDFGALAAICSGGGPPMVLLHGVGLRAEAWAAQIESLSSTWSVIAPDLPGHGESPMLPRQPTLSDYVDQVAMAIGEPVCVAGHSMGAMIALDLAIRYPDKVRCVAALNAIYRRTVEAASAVQSRAAGLNGANADDPGATLARWFGDVTSPEALACEAWLAGVSPAGYKAAYSVFAREDGPADAGLTSLQAPALFATGRAEPNSTPAMSHAMAALVPDGHAIILEGAAHMMPMTHPKAVNKMLAAFFDAYRS